MLARWRHPAALMWRGWPDRENADSSATPLRPTENPLSYADSSMKPAVRLLLRLYERASGIDRVEPIYRAWRSSLNVQPGGALNRLMAACGVTLDLLGTSWPPVALRDRPLVIIANHPFGILDGVAALALAEQLGRPFKIMINADLLRVPEVQHYALPIDFSGTPQARRVNLASGTEAIARLQAGESIVIFPAGGIATASVPWGKAADLPWKSFVAKLVHRARADVVPIYFPGQNSGWFHVASQISMFWRLSLVVPEALRRLGRQIEVRIGPVIVYEEMAGMTDRHALTAMLRRRALALAPEAVAPDREGRIRAWERVQRRYRRRAGTLAS